MMVNSSSKCTTCYGVEHLKGSTVVEAFSWSMIEHIDYICKLRFCYFQEIRSFWEKPSQQAIRIFIGASFPACVRLGKIYLE